MVPVLPDGFGATRGALHRVAVHVLGRRRSALVGKFGLRVSPGGIATPAAGPEHEVLRTDGARLIRERTGDAPRTDVLDLGAATLAEAAAFADVDLDADFSAGHDTPPVGDPDVALGVDHAAATALGGWYAFGWQALDAALAVVGAEARPTVIQLWPEHFDAGCDLGVGDGRRANLGASPGDADHPDPYLYVGPWGEERPGDAAFWNAPFGAVLGHAALAATGDPLEGAVAFLTSGLARLGSDHTG
jgi:hypothetical protein